MHLNVRKLKMKHKQIRHYKREIKVKKMELLEQELDEEVYSQGASTPIGRLNLDTYSQGKKDKNYPNTYLESRNEPIERNKGVRIGDVDNHPDTLKLVWEDYK